MSAKPERAQTSRVVLELIVRKVDPLELCELLDADQAHESEAMKSFAKSMEQELATSMPELRKCQVKIDKEKSRKTKLEEKMEQIEEKIKACKDRLQIASASADDIVDMEETEKGEQAIEDLEAKLEELSDQVDEKTSAIKDLEEEKKESLVQDGRLQQAKDLLKHTLRGLQKAYKYQMSMWQKHCLKVQIESMSNVVEQMKQCIQVAEESNAILKKHAMSRQHAIATPTPELKALTDYHQVSTPEIEEVVE
mmetsp:Transcript_60011/g.73508  ORF Transcript_60011/g.73508 Transcript_60011/m.73508 type:complete len:252 (-) Transcript_60011:84-839(-)